MSNSKRKEATSIIVPNVELVSTIVDRKNEELAAKGSKRRLSEAQKAGITSFIKNMGNASATMRECKIGKKVWERWMNMDEFVEAKEDAVNAKLDFLEAMAQKKAAEGDTTMIIFMLKTLGKGRGYSEKTVENTTNILNINSGEITKLTPQQQLDYIRSVSGAVE